MYYEETKLKLEDAARQQAKADAREQSERRKAIDEAVEYNSIWDKLISAKTEGTTISDFRRKLTDAYVVEGLTVFVDNCVSPVLIREEYNQRLVRQLVSNFVKEEGSIRLLDKFKRTSYLLSEMAYIIENQVESILEKADPKNQESFKVEQQDKEKFYENLGKIDSDKATHAISSRVQLQVNDFINDNMQQKAQLAESLAKTEQKVAAKQNEINTKMAENKAKQEEAAKIEEAYIAMGQRRAIDIVSSRTKNVFEHMVINLSKAAFVNEAAREVFVEDSKINMDKIVEHCEVLCTFVTALDSIKLINVDENYITNMLNDMKK
jgi:hypothetical protein